jgi:RNA polymerase sigma-70 factor, ECF subfamily
MHGPRRHFRAIQVKPTPVVVTFCFLIRFDIQRPCTLSERSTAMSLRVRGRQLSHSDQRNDPSVEESAIVAASLRDRHAFAPLYQAYLDPIYGFCYRRLGEKAAAEDVTAQVFLKALEKLHQFKGGSFKAWLFAIAENTMRDLARSNHSRPLPLEFDSWEDPGPSPEDIAMTKFDEAELRQALTMLPDDWRAVVELRLQRLSCAEVADTLGTGRSVNWVRQVHHRAIERLGEIMLAGSIENGGPR